MKSRSINSKNFAHPKPRKKKGRGWEKRDWAETAARKFEDPRSYVSFRVHPGTSHCCVYLFGRDVEPVRLRIFAAYHGLCFCCGQWAGIFDGDLEHKKGGNGRERCWCDENLQWSRHACNIKKHGRYPQLGRIGATV